MVQKDARRTSGDIDVRKACKELSESELCLRITTERGIISSPSRTVSAAQEVIVLFTAQEKSTLKITFPLSIFLENTNWC